MNADEWDEALNAERPARLAELVRDGVPHHLNERLAAWIRDAMPKPKGRTPKRDADGFTDAQREVVAEVVREALDYLSDKTFAAK
jgi:hypothetical protein